MKPSTSSTNKRASKAATCDELALFRQALAGVTPHKETRADVQPQGSLRIQQKQQDPNYQQRRQAAQATFEQQVQSQLNEGEVPAVTPSEYLSFSVPDLPYRTLQQLKRGHIAWEQGLDLHGYTLESARQEVDAFLQDAKRYKYRCILIVHGKSYSDGMERSPVLKAHVNTWLRQCPQVLAFTSAQARDGGTGAVYVLLRTRQDQTQY